jgi:DNA polymerase-3 subunit beta
MRLTLPRAALAAALDQAARIVERRSTIPILSNVLLAAEGGRLTVRATDLDMQATVSAEAQVAEPGATTVPAHILHDIARKLPADGEVSLEQAGGEGPLVVRAGRSRFQLQTLPESDFPDLAVGEMTAAFSLSGKALARLIGKSEIAISTEETRYYLNGIYFHTIEDGGATWLRAVATDGHRLAQIQTPAPDGAAGMPGIIVPRKAVAELKKLAAAAGDAEIELAVSPAKIRAAYGETVLVSKLIDGTFPDYTRVVPRANPKRLVVEADALAKAIDRVATLGDGKSRAVRVDLEEGRATLALKSADFGEASEEIEAEWEEEPFHVGFNAAYALGILASLDVETLAIALADPGSPMLWAEAAALGSDGEQPNALYVLMPMRV